ncbi:Protein T27F7.1 [Aphelenchoides avenae]|nr:Protein T27F7.1 [Aphelenchus avenae]KAH7710835.1 Protein T27F7.1 [Aphelenchus avenae]
MGLFGATKKDPRDQVREMTRKLNGEKRSISRQIAGIQREEEKVKRQIKEAAKKGDRGACVILAKSLIQSRKTVNKLYLSQSQIQSVIMSMEHQLATIRMAGSIQQSTEVMRAMQQLVKVPQIMQTMREMSKEMTKVGIIEEMIEETMESLEPEDMEEQAQEEVDKILWEVTAGELGKAPAVASGELVAEQAEKERAQADAFIAQVEAMKH